MKFAKYYPTERLKFHIKCFVVSENELGSEYKVFPSTGLVIGFQYKGRLATLGGNSLTHLASAGITGISGSYKTFKSYPNIGTVLVYFTETGFAHFCRLPAHELFNLSLSLEDIFHREDINSAQEKLANAATDQQRIQIVEQFLLSQLQDLRQDNLVTEAVKLIYNSQGAIRIRELSKRLFISQSPLEKRFRKSVGTTPKKFAAIVRFNALIRDLNKTQSLTELGYDYHFFDQAHFSKDFKKFTGETPENFRRLYFKGDSHESF